MAQTPRVLRQAIPWLHFISGFPTALTTMTLDTIDRRTDDILVRVLDWSTSLDVTAARAPSTNSPDPPIGWLP